MVTTSSNTINRPTRAPAAGTTMSQGIICIVAPSEADEYVDGEGWLVKDEVLNKFIVLF